MLLTLGIYAALALFPGLMLLAVPFGIYMVGMVFEKLLVEPFLNTMQLNGQIWEIVSFLLCYVLWWGPFLFHDRINDMANDRHYVKKSFDNVILILGALSFFSFYIFIAIAIQLWLMPWLLTSLGKPLSLVVFSTMNGLANHVGFSLASVVPFLLVVSGISKVSHWMKKRNINSFDKKVVEYVLLSIGIFPLFIGWYLFTR